VDDPARCRDRRGASAGAGGRQERNRENREDSFSACRNPESRQGGAPVRSQRGRLPREYFLDFRASDYSERSRGSERSADIIARFEGPFPSRAREPVNSDARSSLLRSLGANRFFRFLVVGGVNTVFGYGVFAAFILLKLPYPVAALLSTTLSVLFNFKSYGRFVFGSHDNRLIFRFFLVYAICYVVGLAPLAWAKAHGVPILLVAAIFLLPMAALAFTLNRLLVFRGSP
jgi:putative flippase GtrA